MDADEPKSILARDQGMCHQTCTMMKDKLKVDSQKEDAMSQKKMKKGL